MSIGGKVNYYFTGILIILITLLALFGGPKAWGDSNQTNTSGSNTAIEGGYTSESTTTYQDGSSSNSTTTSTTNSNITVLIDLNDIITRMHYV